MHLQRWGIQLRVLKESENADRVRNSDIWVRYGEKASRDFSIRKALFRWVLRSTFIGGACCVYLNRQRIQLDV